MDIAQRALDIEYARNIFDKWVSSFQVYKELSIDDPFPDGENIDNIWTITWGEVSGIDGLNSAATVTPYDEGDFEQPDVSGFYVSKVSHNDHPLDARVVSAMLFPCTDCIDAEDGLIDDDCLTCGGMGDEFFFQLTGLN